MLVLCPAPFVHEIVKLNLRRPFLYDDCLFSVFPLNYDVKGEEVDSQGLSVMTKQPGLWSHPHPSMLKLHYRCVAL